MDWKISLTLNKKACTLTSQECWHMCETLDVIQIRIYLKVITISLGITVEKIQFLIQSSDKLTSECSMHFYSEMASEHTNNVNLYI